MLLLAITYFGFYLHKFLMGDEVNNNEFNNEQNHKDEKEMASAMGNDKVTKESMNQQSFASNEKSQEGEKDIAPPIETKDETQDTIKCLTNESLALATTNVYVSSDVARQINMFNVDNNAKSGRIFDYNYKIGNLTLERRDAQLDENYYKVNIFASKIKVEQESSYKEEDVESESAYICSDEDDDSESAYIYKAEDVDSESVYICKAEDDDSESPYICSDENYDSEGAYIYKAEDDDSESANNIYNKKDVVELDGAKSTIYENVDLHRRAKEEEDEDKDDETGQIVGSMFLTDYSLNTVIVIDETNNHKRNFYCCVCDRLVEHEKNIELHMKSSKHVKALKLSPPLENNECVRCIYDQYHCAVCDKLFKGPLINHFNGTSHILCATFAKNKALNLRQNSILNEKTNKKKSKIKKGKIKSNRQDGHVPTSIMDLNFQKEVISQENYNLSSLPILEKSAYENNVYIQKSRFPDYYNKTESSYGENSNLLQSAACSENYYLSKDINAYEGNCNNILKKTDYEKNCNIPKYEDKAYYENNSANPENFDFGKYKAYEENCNLPSQATLEFYNFLQYMEAYKRKFNLNNSNIHNFPNCKEENFNFPDQATVEFYNFFKNMQAYEKKFNSDNSVNGPENYSFHKCDEENRNLSNSANTLENFNLAKHTKAKAYEENENFNVSKSSYRDKKYNVVDSNKSTEINSCRQENESKIKKKVKRNKSKNDEFENVVENLYEAKFFNRNSELIVEFLGSTLRLDVNSYNFIKKVNKFEIFCMICCMQMEKEYLDRHMKKVFHVIKVKNAYYDPVYGCHLLRAMPHNIYHCTLCNEEFVKKSITTHIFSDNHKNELARSLITDWNCEKPYNKENSPMVIEKKPQVLPMLESEKIMEDNKLKSVNSKPEKTEMVSSTDWNCEKPYNEENSPMVIEKIPPVLPVLESEKNMEDNKLKSVNSKPEKTEMVSSADWNCEKPYNEENSPMVIEKIPPVLPVLESEKNMEDNKLKSVNSKPEKTEMVSSTDWNCEKPYNEENSPMVIEKIPPVLPVLESEKIMEDNKLKSVNSKPEKTEMVSSTDWNCEKPYNEENSPMVTEKKPQVLPVLESEKILEDNKLKSVNSKPEKTEMVSSTDWNCEKPYNEENSPMVIEKIPPVLPVLESEKIMEDNKLKSVNSKPEKTEMVSSTDWNCEKPYNEENGPMVTAKIPPVLPVLESEKILEDNKLKSVNSKPEKTEMVSSTDWNCEKPYNEENSPMVTAKIPPVLPMLESEKILEDNKLKSVNSKPENTEMASSTVLGLDAKKDSVSEDEEILEVTELNLVDWMQENTETVSSTNLRFIAFTDEVLSEDLNQEIHPVLPALESEKTEMASSTVLGLDAKKDSVSEDEEILEVTELNLVDWMQENTETVSSTNLRFIAFTDEVLPEEKSIYRVCGGQPAHRA